MAKNKVKTQITNKRQYKVLVLSNTFVEGLLRTVGEEVEVSEEYYNRVKTERDRQLLAI